MKKSGMLALRPGPVAGFLAASAISVMGVVFIAPKALAQVETGAEGLKLVDFCSSIEGADCYTVNIKNASSATAMSTVIDQNKTSGECEKSSIRVKNTKVGSNAIPNKDVKEYIRLTLNSACAYEVKFNVTNGCTGDTRARIKAGKTPTVVGLDKNCGSLETYKNYG